MKEAKVENCLNENGYTYKYVPDYKLSRINIQKAKDNPARLYRKYDDDHAFAMSERMAAGVEFPAIVVFDLGTQDDELATGLHRIMAAYANGIKTFEAYVVVEPDPRRRAGLP